MSIDVTIEMSTVELDAYVLMEHQQSEYADMSAIIPVETSMNVEEVPYKIIMTEE